MSVLRSIESKLESLFEGVFGRAFRTNVQPVELARKLAKEMDDHRTVSVSRIYVPNEYTVYLSPADREQFDSFEDSLREELQDYLAEHARRESYALLTRPRVLIETDADLDVGEFGIATRMVQPDERRRRDDEPQEQLEPGATMIYKPKTPVPTEAALPADLGLEREVSTLRVVGDGTKLELDKRRILMDGAPTEGQGLLLQIFTQNVIGPIFFEIIQRKGNEGFGEGNFKALFESIELDQMRRGVI